MCSPPITFGCQPKTIELLPAGLGIDLTYDKKLFHPTEPDIGNIKPMPVLLIVSQDRAVRSWQLCNLSRFPIVNPSLLYSISCKLPGPSHHDPGLAASCLCRGTTWLLQA